MNRFSKAVLSSASSLIILLGVSSAPASAADAFTVSSTVTSFTPAGPSEAFTLTFTPAANVNGELNVRITNQGNSSPWLPKQTCVDPSPPSNCGISSFTVDGSSDMRRSFYSNPSSFLNIKMNGAVITAGQTVVLGFAAGAFTVRGAGAYNIEVNAPTGPGNMGKVAITAGATATPTPTPTPTPLASATPTPTPTASVKPVVGTAAALAELPKASTQPKLKFDSSANGLGKSAKKSLKKVAEVAKDGYGVRVTGAAGMQAGVSKDVVKALAKKRAMEIRAYLIKQGVPKEDIIIKTKIFPIGKAPATLVKVETLS